MRERRIGDLKLVLNVADDETFQCANNPVAKSYPLKADG
jgi:hypothetical protein